MSDKMFYLFKGFIVVALIVLSIVTVFASLQFGAVGIFTKAFSNSASLQVFLDLFISIFLFLIWMWFDAKRTKRNFWFWAILALIAGSFSPLLYLLFRKKEDFKFNV